MLSNSGYIKIADFGLSKIVPDITHTICGTPFVLLIFSTFFTRCAHDMLFFCRDYLAPEVVCGQGKIIPFCPLQ
jgi:hypothetical protein